MTRESSVTMSRSNFFKTTLSLVTKSLRPKLPLESGWQTYLGIFNPFGSCTLFFFLNKFSQMIFSFEVNWSLVAFWVNSSEDFFFFFLYSLFGFFFLFFVFRFLFFVFGSLNLVVFLFNNIYIVEEDFRDDELN